VAYSGLSRHVLLGYEPRPINTSLHTIDCLSTYSSSRFIAFSLSIPSISTIRIEDYLFCPFLPRSYHQSSPCDFQGPLPISHIESSCPSRTDTTIVAGFCILCCSISIIFLFARDNWRHRHNLSERELVFLLYILLI
jgi:hypothetical protein